MTGLAVCGGGCRAIMRGAVADHPVTSPPASAGRARPAWWRAGKLVLGFGLAALAVWAVSGKTGELSGAGRYLAHLDWGWLVVAAAAELVSYVAFAAMQRRLLQAGHVGAGLTPMTGVTLAGNAIQNSLPAGVVLAAAYAFRQYRRFGADDVLSGWVVVAMTILSLMSLSTLAAVGLAMAASTGSAFDLVGVIVGLVGAMAGLALLWARREWFLPYAVQVVRLGQWALRRPPADAHHVVRSARARVSAISPSRRDWAVAGTMGAFNWIFDLGCLVMAFLAVHAAIPWRGMLLAYAAAQLATNLPITPGGLGVVEGSLTIALVAFGGAEASTVAAVLVYRLFNFWAMLPIGWCAYGILSVTGRRQQSAVAGDPRVPVREVPSS